MHLLASPVNTRQEKIPGHHRAPHSAALSYGGSGVRRVARGAGVEFGEGEELAWRVVKASCLQGFLLTDCAGTNTLRTMMQVHSQRAGR